MNLFTREELDGGPAVLYEVEVPDNDGVNYLQYDKQMGAQGDALERTRLLRTSQDEVYGYLTSKDGPLTGSPIKRAEGRSSKADDPIATIALMADTAIFLYFDRRFSQTFRLEKGAITRKNSKFVRFLKP